MTGDFAAETELLTSPEAADLLQTALTGDAAVTLPGFTMRLDDLHYRPGSEVTASYTVRYGEPGNVRAAHLLATTAEVTEAVTLRRDDLTLRVWRHPADPRLPGLAASSDPAVVGEWLGVDEPLLRLLTYRPLRRAVVRATSGPAQFFLKVLRPGYDDRLATRQSLLAAAGLAVPIAARPTPGVLISPRADGRSLAQVLLDWNRGASDFPSADDLTTLLDRLPSAVMSLPRRASWTDNLDFHAATARRHLPAASDRISRLVERVEQTLAAGRHGPEVPTHGDFYEANIFADLGGRLRVIDLDSVGPGLREDDLACCLAHLAVLPSLDRQAYSRVPQVVDAWQHAFERQVDPGELRARTAAVLLSLVAGAEATQATRRLEIAEHYLASLA